MLSRRWFAVRCFALPWCLVLATVAAGQDRDNPVLRVDGLVPGGLRTSVTESWGTFDFVVTNFSDQDRLARVVMFYADRPDVHYGREVWIPAKSSMNTWLLAGPIAPDEAALNQPKLKGPPKGPSLARAREVQSLIYDRTDGKDTLVLPRGEERIRSRVVPYRTRESYTCVMLDAESAPDPKPGGLPHWSLRNDEAMDFIRVFRAARELSGIVTPVSYQHPLPPTPDAFDGIDHFILAGNRIANDPGGLRVLRQWIERGGRAWVMLDRTSLDAVAAMLGDAIDFQVIDRVSLNEFQIETHANVPLPMQETFRQRHERPVDFVRVLLPRDEQVRNTIDGYPLWFTRDLGRGKIVFSTLGPRGWHRPRKEKDSPSPYDQLPYLPVPLPALEMLSNEFQAAQDDAFRPEAFHRTLTEEIGYQVVDRTTVALIFGGFLLGTLVLGIVLRRLGRGEMLGWLAPLAALLAGGTFVALGESSRRQVAPTVAEGQIVDAVASAPEVAVRGAVAVYRPNSGPAPMGASRGGIFDVDLKGIQGKTRRLVSTDGDAWHWENLELPAGVRLGTFQQSVQTPQPITAVARFGPDGIEGKLTVAPFTGVEDALVRPASAWSVGRDVAVNLGESGAFRCASGDILPQRQFLASTLLTDLQQRRQELYRQFLDPETWEAAKGLRGSTAETRTLARKAGARHLEGRNVLLAWADPLDTHFSLVPEARQAGSALLVVPMSFERPAPGSRVTIPGPFVTFQRLKDGLPLRLTPEGRQDVDMHLRFQLPPEVLPFTVERARINFRIDAPSRRVRISGVPTRKEDGERVEIQAVTSPLDPMRGDVADAKLLGLDAAGGLHLSLEMRASGQPGEKGPPRRKGAGKGTLGPAMAVEDEKWTIHYLEVELLGKTAS